MRRASALAVAKTIRKKERKLEATAHFHLLFVKLQQRRCRLSVVNSEPLCVCGNANAMVRSACLGPDDVRLGQSAQRNQRKRAFD
mmetsp:Transcript_21906/g.42610  ORF Transcript_21906/g.42610 Transcript_21906/m.42610 type:complete len:85 (-) Transcript_21906:1060-1314(-)